MSNALKILYVMPQTYGDCFVSLGVIAGIKEKYKDCKVYVATEKSYFEMFQGSKLMGNETLVDGVVEYHPSMDNYRNYETWGPQKNTFDIVFNPYIVTQRIPHWIHNGYGASLQRTYANMCNVDAGTFLYDTDNSKVPDGPYITIHSQTRQDPKDYDYMQDIADKIHGIKKVQVGGPGDKKLDGMDVYLQGECSWKQTAGVIRKSKMHLGLDSCCMHMAGYFQTPSVILFGGTFAAQGDEGYDDMIAIETQDRGPCVTSCHLVECEAKKQGYDKCINNISPEEILDEVSKIIGEDKVEGIEPVKISAYMIVRDAIRYGFPYKRAIAAALNVSDEVVIVDGGSTDGTWEDLQKIVKFDSKLKGEEFCVDLSKAGILKVEQHEWDMDNPTLFGDEKTYARQFCTGTHLIQLDADEIIAENKPGELRTIIEKNRLFDVLDLPVINFYGDDETVRVEPNFWKWRISRNDPDIIHGVHAEARQFDADTARITMDKTKSDSCEYIYERNASICKHKPVFNPQLLVVHERMKAGLCTNKEYLAALRHATSKGPVIFHYSWLDLDRKKENGTFWDQTFHGKKDATHNTGKDIAERIENRDKETLIKVSFDHPMKGKNNAKEIGKTLALDIKK